MASNLSVAALLVLSFLSLLFCVSAQGTSDIQVVQQLPEDIQNRITTNESDLVETKAFPNNIGNWSIFYTEHFTTKTCILFNGAIRLNFTAGLGDNLTSNKPQILDVPIDAVSDGSCAETGQWLNLFWESNKGKGKYRYYSLDISFKPDNTSTTYFIDGMSLYVTNSTKASATSSNGRKQLGEGKGQDYEFIYNFQKSFPTNFNRSYFCNKTITISDNLTVVMASLQFEAFRPVTLDPCMYQPADAVCDTNPPTPPTTTSPKSSTAKPTFPTTPAQPTTLAPVEPFFPNNTGNWSIPYDNSTSNSSCILLTGAFQLHLTENSISTSADVPTHPGLVIGSCGSGNGTKGESNTLYLAWVKLQNQMEDVPSKSVLLHVLKLEFSTGEKGKNYFISDIILGRGKWPRADFVDWNLETANSFFEDGNKSLTIFKVDNGKYLTTSLNRSYTCNPEHTIKGNLTIGMAKLRLEAFRPKNLKTFEFDTAEDCESGHSYSGKVGIIVGAVLCVLILFAVTIFIGIRRKWIPNFPCFNRGDSYVPLGSE